MKTEGKNRTKERLVICDPRTLKEHPINQQLYGSSDPEEALIDSIRRKGILQKIRVTCIDSDFYILGGCRRVKAAIALGIEKVECVLEEYPSLHAAEREVIELNTYRPKSEAVLAREIEKLITIHGDEAEDRKIAGLKRGQTTPDSRASDSRRTRTDDLVADLLNISRNRLRNILTVFGEDYRTTKLAEVDAVGGKVDALMISWDAVRRNRLDDLIPLSVATRQVLNFCEAAAEAGIEAKPRLTKQPLSALRLSFVPVDWQAEEVPQISETIYLQDMAVGVGEVAGQFCLVVDDHIATIDPHYFLQFKRTEQEAA